jgi:hypothetical protein
MEIQFIENLLIEFGGVGARSNVKNKLNLILVIAQPSVKISPVNTRDDLLVTQIYPRSFMRGVGR